MNESELSIGGTRAPVPHFPCPWSKSFLNEDLWRITAWKRRFTFSILLWVNLRFDLKRARRCLLLAAACPRDVQRQRDAAGRTLPVFSPLCLFFQTYCWKCISYHQWRPSPTAWPLAVPCGTTTELSHIGLLRLGVSLWGMGCQRPPSPWKSPPFESLPARVVLSKPLSCQSWPALQDPALTISAPRS